MLYNYNANSYKLNNVKTENPNSNVFTYNGISRSMYAQDNFVYDDHGRLVYDLSKGLQINYNQDHMAVEMKITADNGNVYSQKFLYDADGQRVSTLHYTQTTDTATTGYTSAKHYVNYGSTNFLEVKEDLKANTAASIPSILGLSSKVGRILPGNQKEFYIKDYQGSTIRTVRSDGSYNDGFSFQYLPFGLKKDLKVPANGEEVTESYTGKELDEMSMTYYFGARFYDPVLGVWLSPDPARQFNDPYGVGGDFVNFTDPDGQWVHIVVGAVIGAAVGGYQAYQRGYGFSDWKTYAYVGGGAAIGAGAAATGGAVGGAAGGGFLGGVAGGAAAGGVGGSANYLLNSGINSGFSDFDTGDFAKSTLIGAASGAVAGGLSGTGWLGDGVINAFGSGFVGGFTGGLLNGQSLKESAKTGLVSGGVSAGAYTAAWSYDTYYDGTRVESAEKGISEAPEYRSLKGKGLVATDKELILKETMAEQFTKHSSDVTETGEIAYSGRFVKKYLTGEEYFKVTGNINSCGNMCTGTSMQIYSRDTHSIHSHPKHNPLTSNFDVVSASPGDIQAYHNQSVNLGIQGYIFDGSQLRFINVVNPNAATHHVLW